MSPLDYARQIWPKSFTKPEIEAALGCRVSIMEMIKLRAIENTHVKRKHGKVRHVVWRYKPYQLPLPLEEADAARQA